MFTNYQFNSLSFNPAYAGSNEHLTLNVIHRQQWLSMKGAPSTQTIVAHTPLQKERAGIGLSLVNDKIGPSRNVQTALSYAYRIPVGKKKNMKLSFGIQASMQHWRSNWETLTIEQIDDPVYQEPFAQWLPNFGAGVYLSGARFYAGFACPGILENKLKNATQTGFGKNYRHWYASFGGILPFDGEQVVFRPAILIKSAGLFSKHSDIGGMDRRVGAPTSVNLDASFFFRKIFWVGATYRSALQIRQSSGDSVDFWLAWYFRNGVRIGASYDVTVSKLNNAAGNSIEVMAGYEFDIKVKKVASPRYF
jgi:type IX secretion system PorP/SprF family membrane protein